MASPFNKSNPPEPGAAGKPAVARTPDRPVLVFDGDCGFCRFWVERWRAWSGGRAETIPYQDPAVMERFPEIARADCEQAVQFIERDGRVYRAAEAVFQSLAGIFILGWLIRIYQRIPLFARVTEAAYRFVAGHRMLFSRLTRWLWGTNPEPPRYERTTALLVRAMGLMFLCAFVSLWTQVHGLVGERGILPAGEFMQAADRFFDQQGAGFSRIFKLPTLGWLASGDVALHVYCLLGVFCSLLALAGLFPAAALAGGWLLYLTLMGLGQDFLSFQWDILLLEAGLLAAVIAPWRRRLEGAPAGNPLTGILLARWLLFRLMLESGAVKLLSGDPAWRNLSALQHHFETQPLPHGLSWYAHQLPAGLLQTATVVLFVIELLVPFLIFAPRRLRLFAGMAFATLQLAIMATGNYGIFNWLALALCLALLDDRVIASGSAWRARIFPQRARGQPPAPTTSRPPLERTKRITLAVYAAVVIVIGLAHLDNLSGSRSSGGPVTWLRRQLDPLHVVNRYGLFAVMTTTRPELIIEGSLDGNEWKPYVFRYKPGPPDRRPALVPLHMPRLDWQMWFAALQEGNPPRWLGGFAQRLFERSPDVLDLLEMDPFPEQPPRYLRVLAYDYRFANAAMRRNTGKWWITLNRRHYVPVMRWEPPSAAAGQTGR